MEQTKVPENTWFSKELAETQFKQEMGVDHAIHTRMSNSTASQGPDAYDNGLSNHNIARRSSRQLRFGTQRAYC